MQRGADARLEASLGQPRVRNRPGAPRKGARPPAGAKRVPPPRLGVGLLIAAAVIGMGGLIALTGGTSRVEEQRDVAAVKADVAEGQRDSLAAGVRQDATTIAALCATPGPVERALRAAGQCDKARLRLNDPLVASAVPTLTQAQTDDLVKRVLAASGKGATPEQVAAIVLAKIAADPALRGVTEDQVRAIVAAAVAQNAPKNGRDGSSFNGLSFERRGGQCVAVITTTDADGKTAVQTRPVGAAACGESTTPSTPAPTGEPSSPRPSEPEPTAPSTPDPTPDTPTEPGSEDEPPQTDEPDDGPLPGGVIG